MNKSDVFCKIVLCLVALFNSFTAFADTHFSILDFGAKGDGAFLNTMAIQKAIDKCALQGGGIVEIPQGTFITGTIHLKSYVTIYLSNNAILKGSPNLADYPNTAIAVPTRIEHIVGSTQKQVIFAENQTHIGIIGEGTFHANGEAFQDHIDESPNRPYGLRFVNCSDITISGITMRNSAYWMQRYIHCDRLKITGVTVWNHCNLNNDGMDIDGCHDVLISDCFVDSSDDGICLKSEGARNCEDVVVNNCIASSFASALKLGTGSVGGFKRISFSNCIVRPSKALVMSHTSGSKGGMGGIDILEVDGAIADNISFNNIIIDSSDCPIFIKLGARNAKTHKADNSLKESILRNISISDIQITNAGVIPIAITGYPNHYVENVALSNISIHTRGEGTSRDTSMMVMENAAGYPVSGMFASNLPAFGLYLRHVRNITMNNLRFSTASSEVRPCLAAQDIHGAFINLLQTKSQPQAQPHITILKSSQVYFSNSFPKNLMIKMLDADSEIYLEGQRVNKFTAPLMKVERVVLPKIDSALIINESFEYNSSLDLRPGRSKQAAYFGSGKYLKIAHPQIDKLTDMTVSFWMKLDNPSADKYYRIFAKRKAWNDPAGFELEINPALKRLNFSGGNKGVRDQGIIELNYDTEWHYYTATLSDRRMRLYRDGVLVGWDEEVAMPSSTASDFVVGANSQGKDVFEGSIDELKIWGRALHPVEIKNLFGQYR